MRYTRATLIRKMQEYVGLPGVAMTHLDFRRRMRVGKNTVGRHFPDGGWGELVRTAWLQQLGSSGNTKRGAKKWSRAMLAGRLKKFVEETGNREPSKIEFCSWAGISPETIPRYCPRDGWSGLKRDAGLNSERVTHLTSAFTLKQILDAYGEVREYLGGGRPTTGDLDRHCGVSLPAIYGRFEKIDDLHHNWEHYQKTGEIPDPLLVAPDKPVKPKPSLFDFPPLPPLGPVLPSEVEQWSRPPN
ncbi:hypothetical protein [Stratiformator vulcanicus]|uniref:Uncharacterized protein n=1 Tax=Stratiformator vulcanicus TaxID=2527980 RepID=A0A517QVZ0_9PLAN|nr:hypothetical protein [Stratiformator vulcanicus]QDT35733.1 hypothetical protein Pan189_00860 [Stratiformator vulcanicus]